MRLQLQKMSNKQRRLTIRLQIYTIFYFANQTQFPVKWALHEMGLIDTGIRLPLTPLAEQYREPLRNALKDAGII